MHIHEWRKICLSLVWLQATSLGKAQLSRAVNWLLRINNNKLKSPLLGFCLPPTLPMKHLASCLTLTGRPWNWHTHNSCNGWYTRDHSPLWTSFHCHPAGKCSLFYEHVQIQVRAISNRNCLIFSLRVQNNNNNNNNNFFELLTLGIFTTDGKIKNNNNNNNSSVYVMILILMI